MEARLEIYWSAPNKMWVIHRVREGKIEAHKWAETLEQVASAVKQLLY